MDLIFKVSVSVAASLYCIDLIYRYYAAFSQIRLIKKEMELQEMYEKSKVNWN